MVRANFTDGNNYTEAPGLTQWDYGQVLEIHGLDLPKAVEIHFAIYDCPDDAIIRIGNTVDKITRAAIPEKIMEQSQCAVAYVYVSDTQSGETVRTVYMPMTARQKPEAFDAPEDAELFKETIEMVNAAADRAELAKSDAETARDVAQSTADETEAARAEVEALKSQAQTAAESALLSEHNAKASDTAAQTAQAGAETAEGQAELFAGQAEENKNVVEAAKAVVMELGQKVADDKSNVEQAVSDFEIARQNAVKEIKAAENAALENIGTGIDDTLTQSGKAADAKETGDKLSKLKDDLVKQNTELKEYVKSIDGIVVEKHETIIEKGNLIESIIEDQYVFPTNGQIMNDSLYRRTDYIAVIEGETYTSNYQNYAVFFNSDKSYNSRVTWVSENEYYKCVAPTNAKYIIVSYAKGTSQLPKFVHGSGFTETVEVDELKVINKLETIGKKIVFMGDSITHTHLVSEDGKTFTYHINNYPIPLCEKLGATFKNFAQDGAAYKLRDGVTYYQVMENQIATCIATIPPSDVDIIVLSAGTNDGTTNIGTYTGVMNKSIDALDHSKLYEALRYCFYTIRSAYPNAFIYCGIPIQRADGNVDYYAEKTEAIRRMAKNYGLIIVDGEYESGILKDFETWGSEGRYLKDGLHPKDPDGINKLADLYYRVISNTYKFIN